MHYTKIGDQHLIWEMDTLPAIVRERAEVIVGYNSATYSAKVRNGMMKRVKFKFLDNVYVISEFIPMDLTNPVKAQVLLEIKAPDLEETVRDWCQVF